MIILTRGYGQTDRPTNWPTDIATYRAAIADTNSWMKSNLEDNKFWILRKASPAPIVFFEKLEIEDRQTDRPTDSTYLSSLLAGG